MIGYRLVIVSQHHGVDESPLSDAVSSRFSLVTLHNGGPAAAVVRGIQEKVSKGWREKMKAIQSLCLAWGIFIDIAPKIRYYGLWNWDQAVGSLFLFYQYPSPDSWFGKPEFCAVLLTIIRKSLITWRALFCSSFYPFLLIFKILVEQHREVIASFRLMVWRYSFQRTWEIFSWKLTLRVYEINYYEEEKDDFLANPNGYLSFGFVSCWILVVSPEERPLHGRVTNDGGGSEWVGN